MKQFRADIHGNELLPQCRGCYYEEHHGYESRRIKENFKSVIFTEQAFEKSYQQSSWYDRFESAKEAADIVPPIDWHVDLGNECNLACKMCEPRASSLIADKYRKWGLWSNNKTNWVNDPDSWDNFISSVDSTKINRIHFMGGEPMLSKRFRELVDHLIDTNRTDMSISFVTNGTIRDQQFIDKLKKFRSFDIEISLESINRNNDYIRQGSNTQETLANINDLINQQDSHFRVVLRSVPQLLNINNYDQYILWAWNSRVAIQGIPLIHPDYLKVSVLPIELRKTFVKQYQQAREIIESQGTTKFSTITTGRDPSRLDMQLIRECDSMIALLESPEPNNVESLRSNLNQWLTRWDQEYKLDARIYYPEYKEFFESIGYGKV
jgi:molybdenum cofactor biosynthesis enzyme MoaA